MNWLVDKSWNIFKNTNSTCLRKSSILFPSYIIVKLSKTGRLSTGAAEIFFLELYLHIKHAGISGGCCAGSGGCGAALQVCEVFFRCGFRAVGQSTVCSRAGDGGGCTRNIRNRQCCSTVTLLLNKWHPTYRHTDDHLSLFQLVSWFIVCLLSDT